jgi:hypothetical protein
MQRAKIDKTIREMLVGHSTQLDAVYYKPQEEEILEEYLKAIDNLTISNDNRLKQKIVELQGKNENNEYIIESKLQEKDDAYITLSDQVMKLMEEVKLLKSKREKELV